MDRAIEEYLKRCTDGQQFSVTKFLLEHPELRSDSRVLRELVLAEMGFRVQAGESLNAAAWRAEYPELGDEIGMLVSQAQLNNGGLLKDETKSQTLDFSTKFPDPFDTLSNRVASAE
ncbi:MAG: hypothetical protein RL069_1842, partial [Planctomycetota bacterium]